MWCRFNRVGLRNFEMKKAAVAGVLLLALYVGYIAVSLSLLPPVAELKNKKAAMTIQVKDWHGKFHPFVVGPKNRNWTPGGVIPAEMKWSVILAEDANFYKHDGVDVKAIKNAIKYDLEKKSMAKGASTITQQLAKNLYLSREKTITRKLKELYLAVRLEQELTKGRIIELYLNVVELGPMVYGIGQASKYYFGKPVSELNPRECAFLAAMLPGPRIAYNPYRNMAKVLRRSEVILKQLKASRVLSEEEYASAVAYTPNINGLQRKVEESIKKEETVFSNRSGASGGQPVKDMPADGELKVPASAGEEKALSPLPDNSRQEGVKTDRGVQQ
jgi:monofunctional biosynthetic peptidoglycan transglycosylase